MQEWKLLVIKDLPDGRTGGSLLPMENGYWQVTLAEVGGTFVPLNNQEFLEFSKRLPDNSLFNILRQCEPVTNGEFRMVKFLSNGIIALFSNFIYSSSKTIPRFEE